MDLDGVRLVRFLYGDPSGVVRGKQVHAARLPDALTSGLGLTRAQNALNLLDDLVPVDGMEPVGEIRIVPDPATFTRLPWLDGVASMLCDQVGHDGLDWGGCPRGFLRRAVDALAAAGLRVEAAFENEFYLAEDTPDGPRPWGDGPVYSSAGLDRAAPVVNDIVDALDAQGIQVEQAINEYGPGQQEISITRADALAAADRQLQLRDTVRGVVETRHGLLASFAPKPYADHVGSGCHLHFSLWDGDRNAMTPDGDPFGLSATARAFLAGVLDHLPALVALTCPSYLSYARLQPSAWAASTVSWGFDNREAALRIASPFRGPRGREPERRAEDVRREQQPAPRARRPRPRGPRRADPRAHPARARRARPGPPRRRGGPPVRHPAPAPPTRRPRSTRWRPTRSSWPGSATCWDAACSRPAGPSTPVAPRWATRPFGE